MKFKKIYLEITNNCNLSCSFCIKNKRPSQNITIENFNIILSKLKPHTDYLYFHVLGEPLMHPQINELIDIATGQGFSINLTTNGYLLSKIKNNNNLRQINISLHSYHPKYQIKLEDYLFNICTSIEPLLKNNTYINLRLWTQTPYTQDIITYLTNTYQTPIDLTAQNIKIKPHLYLNFDQEFIWPDLNNSYYIEKGTCHATTDHLGILVDGTVIPCCLDSQGIIKLGNILKDSLTEILSHPRFINMKTGFSNNQKREELCKHCNFNDRKK